MNYFVIMPYLSPYIFALLCHGKRVLSITYERVIMCEFIYLQTWGRISFDIVFQRSIKAPELVIG